MKYRLAHQIRTSLLVITCVATGIHAARADERSDAALGKLREKIRSYTSYRMEFTALMIQEGSVKGTITVSGNQFAAEVMGSELFSDGTTQWNYSPRDNEVTIERLDPNNPSVLSNPSRLLGINPNDYNHRMLPSETVKGKALTVVELTPKVKTPDYTSVTLYIDPETSLPTRITISPVDGSTPIELVIGSLTPNVPVSAATFKFDTKVHKGVEVIDFR